jgi:septal ring factor EnvC (AmiA/AmiB activator)
MKLLFIFALLLILNFMPADSRAESKQDLKKIEAQITAEKAKQSELRQKISSMSKDVDSLKKNLIKTTEGVQKFEESTSKLEGKMSVLEKQKADLLDTLNADREKLAGLIAALERIKRTPPEALIARPEAPLKTAQAAIILKSIVPELHKQAEGLRLKLRDLDYVETSLIENREELNRNARKLAEEKETMEALLTARQQSIADTQDDFQEQQKTVAKLSQDAKDMRELIRKIEQKQQKAKEEAERKRAAREKKSKDAKARKESETDRKQREDSDKREEAKEKRQLASLPALGNARLPLNGTLKTRYGQKDDIGATSEGLRIVGRSSAVVVAPLGGVIRYAGPFKKYGTIILLEHKNNYMSLIAGLSRIDTVEGQSVDAGEPLGKMGSGASPILYYELRYKGDPINPASKLGL